MAPQQAVLITDELTVECTSATLTSTGVITKHADQRLRNKKSMPVKTEGLSRKIWLKEKVLMRTNLLDS